MSHPLGVTWTGQSIAAKLTVILSEVIGAAISKNEPLVEVTSLLNPTDVLPASIMIGNVALDPISLEQRHKPRTAFAHHWRHSVS